MSRHAARPSWWRRIDTSWIRGTEGTRAAVWLILACSFLNDLRTAMVTPTIVSVTIATVQAIFLLLLALKPAPTDQNSPE